MMRWNLMIGELLRPLMTRIPRGSTLIYRALGLDEFATWPDTPRRHRLFWNRDIKACMFDDIAHPIGRQHYFLARHYDVENYLLIESFLSDGDLYVDVGASHGVFTMAASRAVGASGRVIAIEPHPATYERLRSLLCLNEMTNCELHSVGLSDTEGTFQLTSPLDVPGLHTFRQVDGDESSDVTVVLGDSLIGELKPEQRVLVKIDTEGFEHHVLRGFTDLLKHERLAFSIEVTNDWLEREGSSAKALFDFMASAGFQAHRMSWHRASGKRLLDLTGFPEPTDERQYDAVFLRPGEAWWKSS